MTRHGSSGCEATADSWVDTQHRCLSCNGIIAGLADEDLGLALDIKLGLVSDECALICNECTARMIEARATERVSAVRRR